MNPRTIPWIHPHSEELGRLLFRTAKKYLGAIAAQLNHIDMERYFALVLLIDRSGKPMSQQGLADYLQIDKAAVVRMLNYLTSKDILERKVNPADRREHMLQLTAKAKKIIPEIRNAINKVNETVLEGLSQSQKNDFLDTLLLMDSRLSKLPAEPYTIRVRKKNK